MKEPDVIDIAKHVIYENTTINGKIEETHISWVILTKHLAFKIKKPLKLDFLDFSTLALRKMMCEKEVSLNSRFSEIYLGVLSVRLVDGQWFIGGQTDDGLVDYCVVMRRLATSKRLDNLMRDGNIMDQSIKALASEIASFHNKAEKIFSPFDINASRSLFNDITAITLVSKEIDMEFGEIISRALTWSDAFLDEHKQRFQQRVDHGLKRDVHGDLHCANIFLYKKPILFDGIEFNDQFRQIDVLYELAFLCMDFERYRQKRFAEILLRHYKKYFPAFQTTEDQKLFIYYKALRANVRAKVHAMQWSQAENDNEVNFQRIEVRKYLMLLNQYMSSL